MAAILNLLKHSTLAWKDRAGEGYDFYKVKKGYALYGELRRYRTNKLMVYWAIRNPDELFQKFPSWAFDVETISALRSRFVKFVGVLVKNGDQYLTSIESFKTEREGGDAKILNYSDHIGAAGKYGALQWYVPLHRFSVKLAPPESTLKMMRIGGR